MIIPAYNEDDILRELLDDYKSVQRKAKKIAMAELEKMARYGKQEKKTELSHYFGGCFSLFINSIRRFYKLD